MAFFGVKQAFFGVKQAFTILILIYLLIIVSEFKDTTERYCPNQGKAAHGKWRLDEKDGLRCILDCDDGYSPNGCHIIRKDRDGKWNHNITTCDEDSMLNGKKIACFTALGSIIVASPYILAALGFSGIGIVAGSLAARWMASIGIVSAGSLFAWLQSIGMTGISWSAFVELMAAEGGACDGLIDFFSDTPCEVE